MVKTRNREVAVMSRKIEKPNKASAIARYSSPELVDHLASNYVMGLLSPLVKKRVDRLRRDIDYRQIDQRISFWEQKLSPLNDHTPNLAPLPQTWKAIETSLNHGQAASQHPRQARGKATNESWWSAFTFGKWSAAFSLIICVVIGFVLLKPTDVTNETGLGNLSYLAVLEDDNQSPQVVATTYGQSKQLVLDILSLPQIDSQETFELWVTSKTDNQTRSLGEIPKGQISFDRLLSDAEWRLIVDSAYLVISIEDEGGSAIGEPSDSIISRGLCIRLANRDKQT